MERTFSKTWAIVALTSVLGLSIAWGQTKETQPIGGGTDKPQLPRCPVMDEPVDFFVSTPTSDGPVYFCCKPCITKYAKDPSEYAQKTTAQREALAKLPKIQVVCPVSGKTVRNDVVLDENGEKIYFCCPSCAEQYQSDPKPHLAKRAASYTYQTMCPIDGERIDPSVFVKIKADNRVYFHQSTCKEAFLKDPKPYLAKLADQGISLEPSDIGDK